MQIMFSDQNISLSKLNEACWSNEPVQCELDSQSLKNIQNSHLQLLKLIENEQAIYGVTTGFGDSSRRPIESRYVESLQANLISYLLCGTGPYFSKEVCRAVMICRLRSLSRGLSGVSVELIERLQMFIANDWVPVIPQEGSLGASGDLIPLAYLAQVIQGRGQIYSTNGFIDTAEVLKEANVQPYTLKAKEGLALVNGTSVMAGLMLINLSSCRALLEWATLASSWCCLALEGRADAFSELINSKAKKFIGQSDVAKKIRELLEQENYQSPQIRVGEMIQDRYSLRCSPQILGPILETLTLSEGWLNEEINGVSDNPVIDGQGQVAMGGNFYGGYISHSMDYMKIGLAHIADMVDRQLATLIDEKANSGLPPNLADWANIPEAERALHHGLKGLHQSVSAMTSELMNKAIPNGIFSRSAESHNQDKVSLGLSAGVQCATMTESLFTIMAHYFVALSQALDIRGVHLKGEESRRTYEMIRKIVPRVKFDQPLDLSIRNLAAVLKLRARKSGGFYEAL